MILQTNKYQELSETMTSPGTQNKVLETYQAVIRMEELAENFKQLF